MHSIVIQIPVSITYTVNFVNIRKKQKSILPCPTAVLFGLKYCIWNKSWSVKLIKKTGFDFNLETLQVNP